MVKYIYEHKDWTDLTWQNGEVSQALDLVRLLQGKLLLQIQSFGFLQKEEKNLETLTLDVLKSSGIEGEALSYDQVRSPIASQLGINTAGLVNSPRNMDSDITQWLLGCMKRTLLTTENSVQNIIDKAMFWEKHANTPTNERQRMMINRLFDWLFGKLTSSKWSKMTKTSTDTALQDIKDLIGKGVLEQDNVGGRSANYMLIDQPELNHSTAKD